MQTKREGGSSRGEEGGNHFRLEARGSVSQQRRAWENLKAHVAGQFSESLPEGIGEFSAVTT